MHFKQRDTLMAVLKSRPRALRLRVIRWIGLAALMTGASHVHCADGTTPSDTPNAPQSMLRSWSDSGFGVTAVFTVGETIGNYQPPGIIDGLAAFESDPATVRILANHELPADAGYPYRLANGLKLNGSRVSFFDFDKKSRRIVAAGLAYDVVRDRAGKIVRDSRQISEREQPGAAGIENLCSGQGYSADQFGFVDDIFFTHEEVSARGKHQHGGTIWALDVKRGELWAAPELGRGAWENSTALATPDQDQPDGHVALLLGDDLEFGGAPLYLWIGRKQPQGNFLARNGLTIGQLYAWISGGDAKSPEDWNGTGAQIDGRFVTVASRDSSMSNRVGYDALGYANDVTLRANARRAGAFFFSRPEDLHTDPRNGERVVFASTGHGEVFPSDDWGTLYLVDVSLATAADGQIIPEGRLTILSDSDERGDFGIRSPDNLVWASDGMVYVQEDKATRIHAFGADSGREASIWRIDPDQPSRVELIAVIDRSVVLPTDARDTRSEEIGAWESSGIVDVTELFDLDEQGLMLMATVQAHTLRDGAIGGRDRLVQGGQIVLIEKQLQPQ